MVFPRLLPNTQKHISPTTSGGVQNCMILCSTVQERSGNTFVYPSLLGVGALCTMKCPIVTYFDVKVHPDLWDRSYTQTLRYFQSRPLGGQVQRTRPTENAQLSARWQSSPPLYFGTRICKQRKYIRNQTQLHWHLSYVLLNLLNSLSFMMIMRVPK